MEHLNLKTPLTKKDIMQIKAGDSVTISGIIVTARDMAHKYLVSEKPDNRIIEKISGGIIYHCGPIIKRGRQEKKYTVTAAGPTTSAREEPYMAEIISRYNLRAIIGKGGMGESTLKACEQHGCVYLSAIGGAACVYSKRIVKVLDVFKLEFGTPEALWVLEVKEFPTIATMDAHGNSLHKTIKQKSRENLKKLFQK